MPLVTLTGATTQKSYLPGLQVVVDIIPAHELTAMPNLANEDDSTYDHATSDFAYVTDVGKGYFRRITIRSKTGQLQSELLGPQGGQGFKNTLRGFVSGADEEQMNFIKSLRNWGFVAIVRPKSGKAKVVGSISDPCYLTEGGFDSQNALGDDPGPGWNFALEMESEFPPIIYEGDANYDPAV